MNKGFIKYDWVKLFILILLTLLLVFLLSRTPTVYAPAIAAEESGLQVQEELVSQEEIEKDELPDFPTTSGLLKLNTEGTRLVDGDGILRFQLSEDGKSWVPVIPDQLLDMLPVDYELMMDESNNWHIVDAEGLVQYTFNLDSYEWEKVTVEAKDTPAVSDEPLINCVDANPARISEVGAKVRVINALIPLRSSPDATSVNIIKPLPPGISLEVTALPVCTPFLDGANLWWGVRTEGGLEGYAAEGSAISDLYYLQEIE